MEGNDTPCICQIYECISCSPPLIYLSAGAALLQAHTTMLMRGVSGEQSQSRERRGEWSWTRSAVGNDHIQQLSTEGPEHTRTHTVTHTLNWPRKKSQNHRSVYSKQAASGVWLWTRYEDRFRGESL